MIHSTVFSQSCVRIFDTHLYTIIHMTNTLYNILSDPRRSAMASHAWGVREEQFGGR